MEWDTLVAAVVLAAVMDMCCQSSGRSVKNAKSGKSGKNGMSEKREMILDSLMCYSQIAIKRGASIPLG